MFFQSLPGFPALQHAHEARIGDIDGVSIFKAAWFGPAGIYLREGRVADAEEIPRIRKPHIAFNYDHRALRPATDQCLCRLR